MLEAGICQWRHIKLGLEATAHRAAADLAVVLKKIRSIWLEVGKSIHAEFFLRRSKRNLKVICYQKQLCCACLGHGDEQITTDIQ